MTSTDRSLVRSTVVLDGVEDDVPVEPRSAAGLQVGVGTATLRLVDDFRRRGWIDNVIVHNVREGLGPSINQALAFIDAQNRYYEHPTHGDPRSVAEFICYCQDDLDYSPGWLQKLFKFFTAFERRERIGFASGVECVEHPVNEVLMVQPPIVSKDWIRAANMFGRRSYWMSMWPIPRLDPETNRVRAHPSDGIGSGVDWHFIRNHPNSVVRSGRTCLVLPGLLRHAGFRNSSWLDRALPESNADVAMIDAVEGS